MSVPPDGGSPPVDDSRGDPQPGEDLGQDADVHAFLIGDVRGWTSFTQEHGDEGAARLAALFAEVTRAVVGEFRGRVVELRGDEVLAVFGSPRSAIRAAVALQQRFVEESTADPSLPLTVGIGLDAGEAVPVEGGFRGGALNVAGRLQARARAGEVLASREIVHLARRIDGIRFTERGQAELKGLDQPVHVIAVASEAQDAAEAMARFVVPAAPAPKSNVRLAVIAMFTVIAVIAALLIVPRLRSGDTSEIEPSSVGLLDPASGELLDTVGMDQPPGRLAVSGDSVWVTNPDARTVTQVDRSDRTVHDLIQVGEDPTDIVAGLGAVWVLESGGPTVSRVSPQTNAIVGDPIPVGNGAADIAIGEGSVWVSNRFDGTVSRIDPVSGEVETIPVGLDPRGLAIGFGSVWVALAGSNDVARIDPKTNSSTRQIEVGSGPTSVAVSDEAVWVVNGIAGTVSRVDPETDEESATVDVGEGPSSIVVVDEVVWVANEAEGSLSSIGPGQAAARTVDIGSVPAGLAAVGGELWVSVRDPSTSHAGGTLKLVSDEQPSSLDSSVAYDTVPWTILHLLGDGLVTFESVGGSDARLVPDLATSIPSPAANGLTYGFTLRPDLRYSSGQEVLASDFLRAFQRGFRLGPGEHFGLYGAIIGAESCVEPPRSCDLTKGIIADDDARTVTFHLSEDAPEFLINLTLPFANPVPPGIPPREQVRAGIPGTGPYMLLEPMTDEGMVLVRNPEFSVWSETARPAGHVDRIEWSFHVPAEAQVQAVRSGIADYAFEAGDSASLDELFVRFPGQLHATTKAQTVWLVLNNQAPPFDDRLVRQAFNLAIDRDRVVQIWGGERAARTTCQQLPPNFPGYEPYCPYTRGHGSSGAWTGPDFEAARRLIDRSGTEGMKIRFQFPRKYEKIHGPILGRYLAGLSRRLGYRLSVTGISNDVWTDPDNDAEMVLGAWSSDYPAASNFVVNILTCGSIIPPSAGFCDQRIDSMVQHALRVQADDPTRSGPLWASIDRAIVDQAPVVWLFNPVAIDFVSERVGNYQYSSQWGPLFDQFWVQ